MEKVKLWLCEHFGHKFNDIQKLMFEIECKALNVQQLQPSITFQRCKKTFTYKPNSLT